MKKLYALAPLIFLGLASAAPPPMPGDGGPPEADGYPPCSRTVTDRCVQTYERGVRRHGPVPEAEAIVAEADDAADAVADSADAVAEAADAGGYPPCTAARRDSCTQGASRRAPTRYAMYERQRIRIGERG
jgi:hypothetical protein